MKSKEKVLIFKGVDRVRRLQYDEALEFFDRVLEMNPENGEAWNNKGVALFRLGRHDEALECYERSIDLNPDNLESMRNIAFLLRAQERFQDAIDQYDMVIAMGGEPEDLEAKAISLVGLGKLEDALSCLMEAAAMKPTSQIEEEIEVLKGMLGISDETDAPEEQG